MGHCQLRYSWYGQISQVDSWGHLKQITSFMVIFFRQHLFWWHLSVLGIYQLLLPRFWPNFKRSLQIFHFQHVIKIINFVLWCEGGDETQSYNLNYNYNLMGFDIIEIILVAQILSVCNILLPAPSPPTRLMHNIFIQNWSF